MGNSRACAPDRNSAFWLSPISPMNSTCGWESSGRIFSSKYSLVRAVHLGRDLQRQTATAGDLDRPVHALLGSDPPEKGEVRRLGALDRRDEALRQPVIDRLRPVRPGHGLALRVGDGDQRYAGMRPVVRPDLRQVEAPVQGRHEGRRLPREQREGPVIDVEMQDVELVGPLEDFLEHHERVRVGVADALVEADRARRHGRQRRRRDGVAAGEKGYVMAERHQLFRQIRNNPFRAPVEFGGHSFSQGRDLRDSHLCLISCPDPGPGGPAGVLLWINC